MELTGSLEERIAAAVEFARSRTVACSRTTPGWR